MDTDHENPSEEESKDLTVPDDKYKLPRTTSFESVDANFDSLTSALSTVVKEIQAHSENTNKNLTKLAEETSENLNKLASDMKSILSSQTMMFTICIIAICSVIVITKSILIGLTAFFHMF